MCRMMAGAIEVAKHLVLGEVFGHLPWDWASRSEIAVSRKEAAVCLMAAIIWRAEVAYSVSEKESAWIARTRE
jgi:hypothetical protein